jgi:hypothetical protein
MNKDAKRNDRKILKLVIGVTAFALLFIVLFIVLFFYVYTPVERPEESYGMNVCFWDHGELVSLRNASKDFDDILLHTVKKVNLQAKCAFFEDRVNLLKQNGKVIELIFDKPVNITISQWIEPEERKHIPTDAKGYRILTNVKKIVFVLEGDLEGHILTKSADIEGYGCWAVGKDGEIDKSWIEKVEAAAFGNSDDKLNY